MQIIHEKTIYQLAFLPRIFPVNCYLVEEHDSLTLIDAALPFSSKGILQAAASIGKPIKRILLTHAHEDHVGALDAVKQASPELLVHISHRDAPLMAGDCTLAPDEPNTPIRGGVPKKLNTRADILLRDGDRIGSLLAVSAPGHTPGSMAYLDTRNNILIAGDAFQTRGGIAVSGKLKPWFPFPAMATWHKQTALDSARKLKDYHPSLLAVGHGRMLKQPDAAIGRAIAEAEAQLGIYT
ncbi:MBL fold metallo-hydrolase [Paenibacillus filicis]|uniref:MBL fold metallo-hydrolase n=1 Tax=Paenibacillus gyeongsangnamensis TaxID=3388067 RepID=A0ABT4Q8L4_9BACL|nr:MBL fold metallo-hydrolase [Paenibacillus filicis]MCZ8513166.1 MBL fold metallo-hydrolase [Paenibacillus filicis]